MAIEVGSEAPASWPAAMPASAARCVSSAARDLSPAPDTSDERGERGGCVASLDSGELLEERHGLVEVGGGHDRRAGLARRRWRARCRRTSERDPLGLRLARRHRSARRPPGPRRPSRALSANVSARRVESVVSRSVTFGLIDVLRRGLRLLPLSTGTGSSAGLVVGLPCLVLSCLVAYGFSALPSPWRRSPSPAHRQVEADAVNDRNSNRSFMRRSSRLCLRSSSSEASRP